MEQKVASKNKSLYFFLLQKRDIQKIQNAVPVAEQQRCYTLLSIVTALLTVTVN